MKIISLLLLLFHTTFIHAFTFTASIKLPRHEPLTKEGAEQNKKDAIADLYKTIIFNTDMVVLQNEKRVNDVMYYSACRDKFKRDC